MRHRLITILLSTLPLVLTAQEVDSLAVRQRQDSITMAPTQVRQYGKEDYEQLTKPQSSLDLQDPENVVTEVEY